jgi:hypothetical protein
LEKLDLDRETRIWQRVSACKAPEVGELRPLLLSAAETVSTYRQLVGMLTGRSREQMKGLLTVAQRSAAVLKGIGRMSGQPPEDMKTLPGQREPAARLLKKSYYRALRQLTEYTARTLDPDYGVVYRSLADREQEAAVVLAELIGRIDDLRA